MNHAIMIKSTIIKAGNRHSPLLLPSGPRRMVHSSIEPKVVNSCRTSSSVCCLLNIPTNSFLSAGSTTARCEIEGTEKKRKNNVSQFRVRAKGVVGVKEKILRLTPRTTKLHGYTSIHHPKGREVGIYRDIYIYKNVTYLYMCTRTIPSTRTVTLVITSTYTSNSTGNRVCVRVCVRVICVCLLCDNSNRVQRREQLS